MLSCKGKQADKRSAPTAVKGQDNKDTTKYFQITHFIQTQIDEVNKTPYFIYKLNVQGERKDSITIDNAQFNHFAKQFLQPDINDPSLKKYYTENIFFDETTKSYTLSYTTPNKDLELQSADILLAEDGRTVKRIFLRKFYNYPDSSAIEQLSWKPNERFQVVRLLQKGRGNSETSTETVVVWNGNG